MLLDVIVLTPNKILFDGKARNMIVPGEQGVFEILPFHKPILSRLISGIMFIEEKIFPIQRGIIKVNHNRVTVVMEEKE